MKAVIVGCWARCSPCAPGFSRNNFHLCQNLIFMLSVIHKVDFCHANVFYLKNIWLTTCYYGLTSMHNVLGCFPSFHNSVKKLRMVTWPSRRSSFDPRLTHLIFYLRPSQIFRVSLPSTSILTTGCLLKHVGYPWVSLFIRKTI